MKSIFHLLIAFYCLTLVEAKENCVRIEVTNPMDMERTEVVSVRWSEIKKIMPEINSSEISVSEVSSENSIMHQLIDENNDGMPEELLFLANVKANEKKTFYVKAGKKETKPVISLTDARFMPPREDIAWENDRIAFRIYGPALAKEVNNGIDVWTKRVRYLIVEKWYRGDEAPGDQRISYHEDHGEGADFFSVGRTLGAGSCALFKDDSLYQPGVFETYKIITTGPIRAIFEVTYKPVEYNGRKVSEVKKYTLDAGGNLNKIDVTYICSPTEGNLVFATGLVKRANVTSYKNKDQGWVSLWGQTNDKIENGYLGTGIVMPAEMIDSIKEDDVHVLIIGKAKPGREVTYYAGAGWTRSGDFNNADDWNNYLKNFALKLKQPLKVSVK